MFFNRIFKNCQLYIKEQKTLILILILVFFVLLYANKNYIFTNENLMIWDEYLKNNKISLVEHEILKEYFYKVKLTEQDIKLLLNLKKQIIKDKLPWYDDAFIDILEAKLKFENLKLKKIIDLYYEFINLRYNRKSIIYTIGWNFNLFCFSFIEKIHYFAWNIEHLTDVFALIEHTNKYTILKSLNPRSYADTYAYLYKFKVVPFDLYYGLDLLGLAIDYRMPLVNFCKDSVNTYHSMDNSVEHLWLALIHIYYEYFTNVSQLEYIMFLKYLIENKYIYNFTLEEILKIRDITEFRLNSKISTSELLEEIKLQTKYKEPKRIFQFLPQNKRLFIGMKVISKKDNIFTYYNYIEKFISLKKLKIKKIFE